MTDQYTSIGSLTIHQTSPKTSLGPTRKSSKSGYPDNLRYVENQSERNKRKRHHNTVSFNPSTLFKQCLNKLKPKISEADRKTLSGYFIAWHFFNKSTVKISYSCMSNTPTTTKAHNNNITKNSNKNMYQTCN